MSKPRKRVERDWVKRMTATYRTNDGLVCDVDKLAKTYIQIGNIPERLSFDKAAEIALLSEAYLRLKTFYAADRRKKAKGNK